MEFKVLTWNMDWHKKKSLHSDAWQLIESQMKPDIALVQEANPGKDFHVSHHIIWKKIEFDSFGNKYINSIGGSGIVTYRYPIKEVTFMNTRPGALVVAELSISDSNNLPNNTLLTVASLYGLCNWGKDENATPALHIMLSDLHPLLKNQVGNRWFIIAGDFNAGLQYDGNSNHENEIFFKRLEEYGLVSCTEITYKGFVQTIRPPRASKPYQPDYIYVSKALSKFFVSCEVLTSSEINSFSDHNPIVATFDL